MNITKINKIMRLNLLCFLKVFLILSVLNINLLYSKENSNNDTLNIISNTNSINLDTTSIAPLFDTQFEPFLEFNTRRSNLTPIADEIIEFENEMYIQNSNSNFRDNSKNISKNISSNLFDLPAIDIFTANKLQQFINDNLFENINIFIDSIESNLNLNSGQKQIIFNKIENLKNRNNLTNKDTKLNFIIRNQTRFGQISGIEEGKFAGNELDIFQRLNLKQRISDNQSLNLMLQTKKDLGEENINEFNSYSIKYINSHSNFLSNSNFNNLKIIVGDFVPKVGFGSVFWTSFAATKGSEVISPTLSFSRTTDQNTSTIDFNKFRGVLGEYTIDLSNNITNNIANNSTNNSSNSKEVLKLLFWYADNNKASTINELNEVTSIAISPSFRTANEISKKNNLNERNITANIEYSITNNNNDNNYNNIFGVLVTNFNYDKALNPTSSIYFKTSNTNSNNSINLYSLYNLYTKDKFSFGTEIAIDDNINYTTKISTQYYDKEFVFSNQLRVSSPEFRSMYGYNFGEIGNLGNQISYYNGIEYKGFKNIKFYNYFEYYSTINKINSLPNKQIGLDVFLETEYKFSKDLKLINRLKYEQKKEAANIVNYNQRVIFDRTKFDFRLELHHNIDNNNRLRLRYEKTFVNFAEHLNNETGDLAFLEYHGHIFEDLKFNSRITYFDTPSFNSAIWQYEYAMPGYTTTNAMFGKGYRLIFGIEYPIFDVLDLNLRYSSTFKNNVDKLGSGNLEILGNNDSRLIFQLNYKY